MKLSYAAKFGIIRGGLKDGELDITHLENAFDAPGAL